MPKALIIIDYINDFVADNGALTCGAPGQAIDGRIAALAREYGGGGYVVVATDAHAEGDPFHPESKLFPPHSLMGGSGRDLYGQTAEAVAGIDAANVIYLDKTRYSAFSGTNLDRLLRERGVTDICLVGVCSDICVLHTAIDAYNIGGYNVTVPADGVATFNPAGHEFALAHFAGTLGMTVS